MCSTPTVMDQEERNRMVMDHTGLVRTVINDLRTSSAVQALGADDAFQEGCIGLLNSLPHYRPEMQVRFTTYAYVCVRRHVLGQARLRRNRSLAMSAAQAEAFDEGNHPPAPVDPDRLELADEQAQLEQVIRRLPRKDQHLVRLFFGLGCEPVPLHTIAWRLRITRQRAQKRLRRALKALKGLLEGEADLAIQR